ncbi:phosphate ABC transporter substrate-binding protein PstS [soil metagenome]
MNKSTGRLVIASIIGLSLVAAACGDEKTATEDPTTVAATGVVTTVPGPTTPSVAPVTGTLQASGSSFQLAFEEEAILAFTDANPGTTITYGGGGSGKGRTDLADKTVDFAGSDGAFKAEDLPADPILYFPILLGAVTVSYNLDAVDTLQLSPDTIAMIFQRQITQWDDPAIAGDNPGVALPSTDITVVHRTDGSGTTENFTKWLAAAAPAAWTLTPGSTVEWPADTQGGNGNQGVAQIVSSTSGAVGYVDLSDAVAAGLSYADVMNKSGAYITPTSESASVAGDGIEVADNLVFHAYDSSAPTAYPITLQSWVIVYAKQSSDDKAALVRAYLTYLLTEGQAILPELDFAPLPDSILTKAIAQLDQITS